MKLIYCRKCHDIFLLVLGLTRSCLCGACSGRYVDAINAAYTGDDAVCLGISNEQFLAAVHNQPDAGLGEDFAAWVMPKDVDSIKKQRKLCGKKMLSDKIKQLMNETGEEWEYLEKHTIFPEWYHDALELENYIEAMKKGKNNEKNIDL